MSECELFHALHSLYSRGDLVELTVMVTGDGRFQTGTRFANARGWGVAIGVQASAVVAQAMLQVAAVSHFPDGALTLKTLPDRVKDWDFETFDLMGGCDVRIPDDIASRFDHMMAFGHIRSIRWSRCSDSHWELGVMYTPGLDNGPLHIAAPLNNPAAALLELIEYWERYDPVAGRNPECGRCQDVGIIPDGELGVGVPCECRGSEDPGRTIDEEIDDLLG